MTKSFEYGKSLETGKRQNPLRQQKRDWRGAPNDLLDVIDDGDDDDSQFDDVEYEDGGWAWLDWLGGPQWGVFFNL